MRIITGKRARTPLIGPKDMTTRPITDRVKEALFSILGKDLSHAVVADIFCGTGSMGLEAVSRGAKHAVMIDMDRDAIVRLKKNITRCEFDDLTTIIRTDAFKHGIPVGFTNSYGSPCNLVFVDPPFPLSRDAQLDSKLGKLMCKLADQVADDATVVIRHEVRSKLLDEYSRLTRTDRRDYGIMTLSFYEKKSDSGQSDHD